MAFGLRNDTPSLWETSTGVTRGVGTRRDGGMCEAETEQQSLWLTSIIPCRVVDEYHVAMDMKYAFIIAVGRTYEDIPGASSVIPKQRCK